MITRFCKHRHSSVSDEETAQDRLKEARCLYSCFCMAYAAAPGVARSPGKVGCSDTHCTNCSQLFRVEKHTPVMVKGSGYANVERVFIRWISRQIAGSSRDYLICYEICCIILRVCCLRLKETLDIPASCICSLSEQKHLPEVDFDPGRRRTILASQ